MNRSALAVLLIALAAGAPAVAAQDSDPRRGIEPFVPPMVLPGRCDHERVGRWLGGAAGAAIGSQIGDGMERRIAIVGGAVIGALVGGHIGRTIDEADRACTAVDPSRTGVPAPRQGPQPTPQDPVWQSPA